jgi:hypothetical protein
MASGVAQVMVGVVCLTVWLTAVDVLALKFVSPP